MAIEYIGEVARVSGSCPVTDALDFSEWLADASSERLVDLEEATHLHLAVYQCLRKYKPTISSPPKDEFLAGLIDDLYSGKTSPAEEGVEQ